MKPNLIQMLIQQNQLHSESHASKARKCPVCVETELVRAERQGVEIDCCPKCRGIWLDRGEFEMILARSVNSSMEPRAHQAPRLGYEDRDRASRH
jgi:uncharacterized protein